MFIFRKPVSKYTGALLIASGCSLAWGCSDVPPGNVEVTVWGEGYIEEEIPSDEFEDGWTVVYDAFHVVVGRFNLETSGGSAYGMDSMSALDLTQEGPHDLATIPDVTPRAYEAVGYRIAPATKNTKRHSSLGKEDFDRLVSNGYSLYVEGTATKDGATKYFAWGFAQEVHYEDCVDVREGQDIRGIVVRDGATEQHQVTIHGDHLFYDDLASDEAVLRFDAMAAADVNEDDDVTLEELDAVELSSLDDSAGTYGVGASDVNTLAEFVTAATQSIGHFDGEGHCTARLVK